MQHKRTPQQPSSAETPVSAPSPFTFAKYSIASVSHPDGNEDRIIADAQTGLAAVLDGVGSTAGAVASRIAARVIRQRWKRVIHDISPDGISAQERGQPDIPAALEQIIEAANARLQPGETGAVDADGKPAATATTVALAVFYQRDSEDEYTMFYVHVGDSRIYLLRSNEPLARLTEDDGYMGKLIKEDKLSRADALRIDQAMYSDQLTEEEREYFEKRNGIAQALGDETPPTPHLGQITLVPGDRILLCSDGIHDNLLDSEIEETLRQKARISPARALVQRALKRSQEDSSVTLRPKADDMSALVVTYHGA
jgi:serine/threonine protein phosphatase PrpC